MHARAHTHLHTFKSEQVDSDMMLKKMRNPNIVLSVDAVTSVFRTERPCKAPGLDRVLKHITCVYKAAAAFQRLFHLALDTRVASHLCENFHNCA